MRQKGPAFKIANQTQTVADQSVQHVTNLLYTKLVPHESQLGNTARPNTRHTAND